MPGSRLLNDKFSVTSGQKYIKTGCAWIKKIREDMRAIGLTVDDSMDKE